MVIRPQWQDGGSAGDAGGGGVGSQATTTTATAAQQVGVVDVDTMLGYRGGRAAGTGMILTSSGEVLTNAHVVSGATSVAVTVVTTGRTYQASVVGVDSSADVAVLQMRSASGLTPVRTASGDVSVGDAVVGVGNAGGEGGTPRAAPGQVTGVDQTVTATDQNGSAPETLTGMIETNAAIKAGDSGGPLYNSSDQVVGMDTAAAIDRASDAYAIPIGTAKAVAQQIESGSDQRSGQTAGQGSGRGSVQPGAHGFLGVEVQDGFGGPVVAAVVPGSPAESAGLTAGSTITSVDDQTLASTSDLLSVLSGSEPGQRVGLTWVDVDGQSHASTVTLGNSQT